MRGWIGSLVLVAGVSGLGWYAQTAVAPGIEADISARAEAIAGTAQHAITVVTSGRDLQVSGRAIDAERAALLAAFSDVEGVRVVDASGLTALPVVSPFELRLTQTSGGPIAQGSIPSDAFRDLPQIGDSAQVELAAGAPDAAWGDALRVGLVALELVQDGELVLSDRSVTLSGVVDGPELRDRLNAVLADLPDGYMLTDAIDVLDDGTPIRFEMTIADGAPSVQGKLPLGFAPEELAGVLGDTDLSDLTQARIPLGPVDWPDAVLISIEGAMHLIDADLVIEGQSVSLSGRGTPEDIAAAEAVMASLSGTYSKSLNLSLWDDGAPFELRMSWDGVTAEAEGKVPARFIYSGPAGNPVQSDAAESFLPDANGAFTTNADAGVAALSLLASGTLVATDSEIQVAGVAASPQVGVAIGQILANSVAGTVVSRELTFLDDGSPAAWVLRYDAEGGASVEGRLPVGLSPETLGTAIGLTELTSNAVTAVEDNTLGRADAVLRELAPYLTDFESLIYSQDGEGAAVDLVVSPGVDIDLVATRLVETLPGDVAFSVSPLDPIPPRGSTRVNAVTGITEVFLNGFWIPDLNFETTLGGCAEAAQAQLDQTPIGFVSGSARLDAASLRAVNALAAVALPCVEADLELEVSGHTDATGDADENQLLSQDRAAAVRAALVARGLPARAITSIGFGAAQPIADNTTEEGRAANRRTEIAWFERGALRDP